MMLRAYTITLWATKDPNHHQSSTVYRETVAEARDVAVRNLRRHRNTAQGVPTFDAWSVIGSVKPGELPKILATGGTEGVT